MKPTNPSLLQLDRVSVQRDGLTILNRVSLEIFKGQHTVIFGPNGSGKSSLLKLLTRAFYPSIEPDGFRGSIEILGRNDWNIAELHRQIGIINATLDDQFSSGRAGRMTVAQAVASGFSGARLPHFVPPLTPPMRQSLDQAIERVEMQDLRERKLGTLSTGERRRVLIARALVHSPSVLVLDEPTAGLDIVSRHCLLEHFQRIAQESEATLLLVTHHAEEIFPEIVNTLMLKDGSVWFSGSVDSGFTSDRLTGLFGREVSLARLPSGLMSMDLGETASAR